MYWYKIVEKDKSNNFRMLFHGINGSRIIPIGEWVKSDQKLVRDGSTGTQYKSGWHVMMDLDECREYLSKFTADLNRVVVKVEISGELWPKSHSPSNVHLCQFIKIIEEVE